METARSENIISESKSTCGIFKKRKKNKLLRPLADEEIYEPVVQQSGHLVPRKTLLLVGVPNVGRRSIKKLLIDMDKRFAYPLPHTNRARPQVDSEDDSLPDDMDGGRLTYYHVPHDAMMEAISRGEYLEHGRFDDAVFGTKFDTIDKIIKRDLIPVLDVEPESVKKLRNAHYSPYVVFVGAPAHFPNRNINDEQALRDLSQFVRDSAELENAYKAFFDLRIENMNIEQSVLTIRSNFDRANSSNQDWIPLSWMNSNSSP
jgi:guanylate kinase